MNNEDKRQMEARNGNLSPLPLFQKNFNWISSWILQVFTCLKHIFSIQNVEKKTLLTNNNISSYFTILRDYFAHRYLFDPEMNSETKRGDNFIISLVLAKGNNSCHLLVAVYDLFIEFEHFIEDRVNLKFHVNFGVWD